MNICIFGDSIGKGIVLDTASERYKPLKFSLIEPLKRFHNVSLKNYSIFGCTVTKGLSLFKRHSEKLNENDLVILEYGGNDCDFAWEEITKAPEKEHKPKTVLEVFISTYQNLIEKIQKIGANPVLLTLPPLDAKRFLNWVSKGLNVESILKWLGSVDMIYRWQEMYSLAVVKLAKALCLPLIDVRSEFLCRQDLPELICKDGMHPTLKGYELIAKTVCEHLAFCG